MKDDQYLELLLKEADAQITDTERAKLHAWIEASEANRQRADQLRTAWEVTAQTDDLIAIDLDAEYERIDTRIKKKQLSKRTFRIQPWQIAAGILVLIGVFWFSGSLNRGSDGVVYSGPQEQLMLSDGSVIWLSDHASFEYEEQDAARTGVFSGKGYFEIAADASKPFTIKTALGNVTVLGTAFEIDMSVSDVMSVHVSEGRVRLQSGNSAVEMTRGERGIVVGSNIRKEKAMHPAGAWRLEPLVFDQVTLGVVLGEVEKYYDVDFTTEDLSILNCRVSFTLSYVALDEIVAILEALSNIQIQAQGEAQYSVSGTGCH